MLLIVFETQEESDKFTQLYEEYRFPVMNILTSIVHDHWIAEELTQDTFLKLSHHMHKVGEVKEKETKYYIITIAKHLAYDYLNKKKQENTSSYDAMGEDSIFSEENVLAFCIQTEEYEILLELIGKMKDIYKIPLQLRYINGLSAKQIAKLLDLPVETVKKRLSRAKTSLQELLTQAKAGGNFT